jgi:uncharacterized protein DUF4189
MKGIGRSCYGAACLVAASFLGVSRADAWGALAIGAPPDRSQAITAGVVGKPTEDEARKAALELCRATKSGSDQARSACVVVGTFQNQCFAFAGANWVLAATEQAARVQASANCYDRACTVSSGCDGARQASQSARY